MNSTEPFNAKDVLNGAKTLLNILKYQKGESLISSHLRAQFRSTVNDIVNTTDDFIRCIVSDENADNEAMMVDEDSD